MVAQNWNIEIFWFTLSLLEDLLQQAAFVLKITSPEGVLWNSVGFCI